MSNNISKRQTENDYTFIWMSPIFSSRENPTKIFKKKIPLRGLGLKGGWGCAPLTPPKKNACLQVC